MEIYQQPSRQAWRIIQEWTPWWESVVHQKQSWLPQHSNALVEKFSVRFGHAMKKSVRSLRPMVSMWIGCTALMTWSEAMTFRLPQQALPAENSSTALNISAGAHEHPLLRCVHINGQCAI